MNTILRTIIRVLTGMLIFTFFMMNGCKQSDEPSPQKTREESIPENAVKMTPETDKYPPVLHSAEWEYPVPLGIPVNTAGAEDSPFIPIDRDELYFFFTPDVNIPPEQQVSDQVTGIYVSKYDNNKWLNPERVWLQDPGKLALDGAQFIENNEMLFVSAREGYTGLHWFSAQFVNFFRVLQ